MIRAIVIAICMLGTSELVGRWFPTSHHAAFMVGGIAITWVFLAAMTSGLVTYKVTK